MHAAAARWKASQNDGHVWVSREIGETATAAFRVETRGDRPIIAEARIVAATDGSNDGLGAELLRDAVVTGGVIDAAEPLLEASGFQWPVQLRAVRDVALSERDSEIALTMVGYVTAVDGGSRKPVVEVAEALGLSARRVRGSIHEARERGLLERNGEVPAPGHWRGVQGGCLTSSGVEAFLRLLERRAGVIPGGDLRSTISDSPGTATTLLRFLSEPPSPGPRRESAAVSFDASGVTEESVEDTMGSKNIAPDGTVYSVRRL